MRRTMLVMATSVVMVMSMATAALATGYGANDVGKAFGQAIAEARSAGTAAHSGGGYPGGLPAFLSVHGG
jgi:hypothetical protein